MVLACYRIKHDSWTSREAMVEAKRYGLSRFERGMRRYVLEFSRPRTEQTVPLAAERPPR
jgi:hypothetical protein